MVLAIDFFHFIDIDFSFTANLDFGRWKQRLFNISFFANVKNIYLKKIS